MDKYLLNILLEVNTIIIPGLGALTVTNKATGEYMFMPYLKHDDGALAKHISEKEGMDLNDAKNLIAKYVREIQAKLDTGDTYDMYQFGRFVKKDGDVDFEAWAAYQGSGEGEIVDFSSSRSSNDSAQSASEIKAEEVVQETKEETAPISIHEDLATAKPIGEAKSLDEILGSETENDQHAHVGKEVVIEEKPLPVEETKEEVKAEEPLIVEEATIDVTEIKPNENVYIPEEEVKQIAAKQEAEKKVAQPAKKVKEKKKNPAKQAVEAKERKKKSPMFWVMMLVILLLVGGGVSYGVFHKEINAKLFGKPEKAEEKAELAKTDENLEEIENQVELEQNQEEASGQESTEAATEEAPKTETPEKGEEKISAPPPSGSGGSFHIIAGGFGVEANAQRLAKKYQAEGKDSKVLGKFNELYLVSYESFSSQEEAASALKSSGMKGWIFKYPK